MASTGRIEVGSTVATIFNLVAHQPETKPNKTGNKQFVISPQAQAPLPKPLGSPPAGCRSPPPRRRVSLRRGRRQHYIAPERCSTRYAMAAQTTRLAGTTPHTRASTCRRCPRASSKTPPFGTCAGNTVIVHTHKRALALAARLHTWTRHIRYESYTTALLVVYINSASNQLHHWRRTNASVLSHNECVLYHDYFHKQ